MIAHTLPTIYEPEPGSTELPDPELRLSPLARPTGILTQYKYPDCKTCHYRAGCIESVVDLGPFARPECEMAAASYTRKKGPERWQQVMAVLKAHPEGVTSPELAAGAELPLGQVSTVLYTLERRGWVRVDRSNYHAFVYHAKRDLCE